MDANPRQHRFTLVFDREGCSPALFAEMQARRIAVLTYHKYPEQDWPVEEFHELTVSLVSGEPVPMRLARSGVLSSTMASVLRETMARSEDIRALLRQIYNTEADLIPDAENKTLTVSMHHLTQAAHDQALSALCDELNATETTFLGTDLRLIFKIGSC